MSKLGSVNLIVKNIGDSERFYVDVLGLTVDEERTNRPSFVLLRASNCMIILQDGSNIDPVPDSPIEIAFQVDNLAALQQKLGSQAVIREMGWAKAIETTDPDRIRLNFYQSQGDPK
jgi:catechol 2,3-dioxygenase-like lactoylglutathione lyase family enzyme